MNPYETEALVSQYLEFHYGASYFGVSNFPRQVALEALKLVSKFDSALDLGCAVGRTSFELATQFERVVGIDASLAFIQSCQRVQSSGQASYDIIEEGELTAHKTVTLDQLTLAETAQKCHFEVGDAHHLAPEHTNFDLIVCANLIDRLQNPAQCLTSLIDRLAPGGLLFITSPYTWLSEFTAKSRWLGGYLEDDQPVRTRTHLATILHPLERCDALPELPFVIRETARKYQHTLADVTVWRKPA